MAGWATVQGELQEWTGGWVSTVTWSYTEVVTGYVVHFQYETSALPAFGHVIKKKQK